MAIILPYARVVCKKTGENISELRFLVPLSELNPNFQRFFRCRLSDKEVIIRAQQVFHDYSTIMPVSQIRTVLA